MATYVRSDGHRATKMPVGRCLMEPARHRIVRHCLNGGYGEHPTAADHAISVARWPAGV